MNEAVHIVFERAIAAAANLLDSLRPEMLDGASVSQVISGVQYRLTARVAKDGAVLPNQLPPGTRASVCQVYEAAVTVLAAKGRAGWVVGSEIRASLKKRFPPIELAPRTVASALNVLEAIGFLHHRRGRGYQLPGPNLFA